MRDGWFVGGLFGLSKKVAVNARYATGVPARPKNLRIDGARIGVDTEIKANRLLLTTILGG